MENCLIDRTELYAMIESLPEEAEFTLRVTGRSMEPYFINRRTVVYLRKVVGYAPVVGDVVLFCRPDGAFVLHRVHAILPEGTLVINGDGQVWTETIHPAQVLAVVTGFCRKEKSRLKRMDSFGCRFWKKFWRPLKRIHGFASTCYYYRTRIPYKLGLKKDKKEVSE